MDPSLQSQPALHENDKNRTTLIVVVSVAIVLIVAGAFFFARKSEPPINSFADCAKAGNPVQESYPEVCVTKDGKRFVNQDQLNFLEIKEWGIRLNTQNKATMTHYSVTKDDKNKIMISSRELDDFVRARKECAIANKQVSIVRTKDSQKAGKEAVLVGEYYYFTKSSSVVPCLGSNIKKIRELNNQAYDLQWVLPTAGDIVLTAL